MQIIKQSPTLLADIKRAIALPAEDSSQIRDIVSDIIKDIQTNGDKAVAKYTQEFDNNSAKRITEAEIKQAFADIEPQVEEALRVAVARVADYHKRQLPQNLTYLDENGAKLGWQWKAIRSAGLYVPGGKATYPSSVVHNAVLAKTAGVERLVVTVPCPNGYVNPSILVACKLAGVDEIHTIGGAQAVAALAYGTDSISPVDVIVGPGNAFVAEAKRQVFGVVGIDMIAGPSNVVVVADASCNANWVATDLLAQAEHDEMAQAILITDDAAFADKVIAEVEMLLTKLQRADIARTSWQNRAVVIIADASQHIDIIDCIAPEHLELQVANGESMAKQVRNSGAIFIGQYTPEAIGDYVAGPSHVLPTESTARFASGLSVYDFLKKSSILQFDADSLSKIGQHAENLAEAEGLECHGLSVKIRG